MKLVLSFLLVVPPASAMGAVFPWVLSATPPRTTDSTRRSLTLYAINTAGGIAGLLCVAFLLIPAWGARGSMIAAMVGNVLTGTILLVADQRENRGHALRRNDLPGRTPIAVMPLATAFVSGAALLAFEVLALQALMLVAPLSYHSPAVFLVTVLSALAIGTVAVTWLLQTGSASQWLSALVPWCAIATVMTPWLFMILAGMVGFGPERLFSVFVLKTLLFCVCAFSPALFLLSLVFPLAVSASSEGGQQVIPWGRLLAINGIGGWLGAELAVTTLMPACGLYRGLGVISIVLAVGGLAIALRQTQRRLGQCLVSLGAIVVAMFLTLGPLGRLPHVNPHLGFHIVDQRLGREGVVSVVEHESFGRAFLVSNQYLLGSTQATPDQRRQALLPLVLHPQPREVAFIGIATGITPGAALDVEGVEAVTAIELSHSVAEMAEQHFQKENRGVISDPRVSVVLDDGRTVLSASRNQYDVVVGDLILPWSPGEGRLYTQEHFESARRSLREGGLYCQWIPMYQLTRTQFEMIVRTFCSVFPRAEMLRREFGFQTPAIALIGWKSDAVIDWDVVGERCHKLRRDGRVLDPSVRHLAAVEMLYLGDAKSFGRDGVLNCLDYPAIEFDAGRERVTGNPRTKYLSGSRWLELMASMVERMDVIKPQTAMAHLGERWSQHEVVLRQRKIGKSSRMASRLPPLTLPQALMEDADADWKQWPGSEELVRRVVLVRTTASNPRGTRLKSE